jgi:hypothetical protein
MRAAQVEQGALAKAVQEAKEIYIEAPGTSEILQKMVDSTDSNPLPGTLAPPYNTSSEAFNVADAQFIALSSKGLQVPTGHQPGQYRARDTLTWKLTGRTTRGKDRTRVDMRRLPTICSCEHQWKLGESSCSTARRASLQWLPPRLDRKRSSDGRHTGMDRISPRPRRRWKKFNLSIAPTGAAPRTKRYAAVRTRQRARDSLPYQRAGWGSTWSLTTPPYFDFLKNALDDVGMRIDLTIKPARIAVS